MTAELATQLFGFGLLGVGGALAAALAAACAAYNRRGRRLFRAWTRDGKAGKT